MFCDLEHITLVEWEVYDLFEVVSIYLVKFTLTQIGKSLSTTNVYIPTIITGTEAGLSKLQILPHQ